jgi:hypothetical protein
MQGWEEGDAENLLSTTKSSLLLSHADYPFSVLDATWLDVAILIP